MCDSDCGCERHEGEGRCHRHRPERGWLQLLFLRLIHEKPVHGYQLMEELNGRGFVQPDRLEAGTVYTILRRMEQHGLVSSKWEEKASGPDRRVYTVTPDGEELLRQGIEAMLLRKVLIDELSAYYDSHLRRTADKE